MVAPIEHKIDRRGCAALEVRLVSGESAVTSSFSTSPLKLLTPRSRGTSVWAYISSFGGGLLAGDQTQLELQMGSGTRCFLGTQASTKVYRNPQGRPCGHHTKATLETGSLLVFAPDPVQAFANSTYVQRQEFHLAPDAGLVLLDWFTAGRTARGERWAFNRFQSRNEVWLADHRIEQPADGKFANVLPAPPPTLALSHRERKQQSTPGQNAGDQREKTGADVRVSRRRIPPLPEGEGRGEGKASHKNQELVFLDSVLFDSSRGDLANAHH